MVVYFIECEKCGKQYVGETGNPLHVRMNGDQSDYHRNLPDQPVAVHFNLVDHSFDNLSIQVIEQVWRDDPAYRKLQESYWIYTLKSLAPNGLNLDP